MILLCQILVSRVMLFLLCRFTEGYRFFQLDVLAKQLCNFATALCFQRSQGSMHRQRHLIM
jgi:hypothetical protein